MFLYLVPITGPLLWTDLPGVRFEEALRLAPDLSGLEWQPAGITRTRDDVRVALRHGEPVRKGIALPGLHLTDLRREDEMRMLNTAARTSGEELTEHDEMVESVLPGWTKRGEELNEEIDQHVESRALEHQARVRELLGADPRSHLVEHWTQLGGELPEPL